jgi:SanA protein
MNNQHYSDVNLEKSGGRSSIAELLKKFRWKLACLVFLPLIVVGAPNFWIVFSGESCVYTNPEDLPFNEIGLVLAALPRSRNGKIKPLFQARMEAAARLYHKGKVKHLLLSGSGDNNGYDEPAEMRALAIELGVPESAMTLDHAGLRTLDSIARAKEVYGLTHFTIITNQYHTYRALFLSRHYRLHAVAFSAEKIPLKALASNLVREWLARVKAVLDVYLFHTPPKFLGPKIEIKITDTVGLHFIQSPSQSGRRLDKVEPERIFDHGRLFRNASSEKARYQRIAPDCARQCAVWFF